MNNAPWDGAGATDAPSEEIKRRRAQREARETEDRKRKEEEERRVRWVKRRRCPSHQSPRTDMSSRPRPRADGGLAAQRQAAKERLRRAMAAPEDDREWIKDVNETASNAESLKLKVMNEKRPDVLSFRYERAIANRREKATREWSRRRRP